MPVQAVCAALKLLALVGSAVVAACAACIFVPLLVLVCGPTPRCLRVLGLWPGMVHLNASTRPP